MSRKLIEFDQEISIVSSATAVGKLESEGPLASYFDLVSSDGKFGMDTWEKAEAEMVRECTETALKKARFTSDMVDAVLGGDLTNQCAASTFGIKDKKIPAIGLYGACSTFALSIGMGAVMIESGKVDTALCTASSHFSTAERQYRFPLEYGCQRTPTAQTTVTGAGSVILGKNYKTNLKMKEFLPGIIRDLGITDANNMGAAMAPACADTLIRYFNETNRNPNDFDMILTGDLGLEGKRILRLLCEKQSLNLKDNYFDCGELIFDLNQQEVGCGGSGCGCSAAVFSAYVVSLMSQADQYDILLIGTGALLNANTVLQGESIPGVAHLIRIKKEKV